MPGLSDAFLAITAAAGIAVLATRMPFGEYTYAAMFVFFLFAVFGTFPTLSPFN